MVRFLLDRPASTLFFASALGAIASVGLPAMAASDNTVPGLIRVIGTGEGITPGASVQDNNWTIQNFPAPGVSNAPTTTPVSLYIPSSTLAWYSNTSGTPTTSTTNAGAKGIGSDSAITYRWGTSNPNNSSDSVPSGTFAGNTNYSYVVSTSFTVSKSATYNFVTNLSGDNRVSVFLGGTPTNSSTTTPLCNQANPLDCTVSGGQLLGSTAAGPAGLYNISSNGLSLTAGTYTLNYVVTDFYGASNTYGANGLLVSTTFFTEAVPAPLPVMGASVFFAYSRKLRRKIKTIA